MKKLFFLILVLGLLGGVASAEMVILQCPFVEGYMGLNNGETSRINKSDSEYSIVSVPKNIMLHMDNKLINMMKAKIWNNETIETSWIDGSMEKSLTLNRYSGELRFESYLNDKLLLRLYYNCSKEQKKKKF